MKKFNSKYGVVQEQDRSGFKNHRDGMRSFEPIDGRMTPVAITFDPECSTDLYFLQETGIDLGARFCAACDKIEVELDDEFCEHCAQEKKKDHTERNVQVMNEAYKTNYPERQPSMNLAAYLDTYRSATPEDHADYLETERREILIEGIRNWRLVKAQEDGVADLEEMTIGEAKTLASFISRTYLIDVTWSNIFQRIRTMLKD